MTPQATRSTSNSLCRCVLQEDSATQGCHVNRFKHHPPKHSQRKLIERITCSRGVSTEAKHRHHRDHKLLIWSKNKDNGSNVVIEPLAVHSNIGDALSDSSASIATSDKNSNAGPQLLSNRASVPLFVSSELKITKKRDRISANEKSVQLDLRKAKCNKEKAFRMTQSLSNNLLKIVSEKPLKVKYSRSKSRSGLLKQAEAKIDTKFTKHMSVDQKTKEEKRTDRIVTINDDRKFDNNIMKKRIIKTSRAHLRKCGVTLSQVVVSQRHRSSGTDDQLSGSIGDITTWATAVITDILYKPETRKSTTQIEKHPKKHLSQKVMLNKNFDSKRLRVSKKVSSGMIVKQRILSQCKNKKLLEDVKMRKTNLKRQKSTQKQQDISNLTVGSCNNSSDNVKVPGPENYNTKFIDKTIIVESKERNAKERKPTSPKKSEKLAVHILTSSTKCNVSCTSIDRRKEIVYRPVVKKCFSVLKSRNTDEIRKHKESFMKDNVRAMISQHDIENRGDVAIFNKLKVDTENKRKEEEKERSKYKSHFKSAENKTYTIEPKRPDERTQRRALKQAAELRATTKLKATNPYLSIKKIQHDNNQHSLIDELRTTGKVINPFKKIVDPNDPPPKCALQIGSSFSFEMELFKLKQNMLSSSSSSNEKLSEDKRVNRSKLYRRRPQKKSPSFTKPLGEREQIHCTLDLAVQNNKWNPNKLYKSEPFENKDICEKKSKKRHKRSRVGDDFITREVVSSISCPLNEIDNQNMKQKSFNSKIPAKTNNIVAKLKRCFCAFKFPNKFKENNIRQPYISPSGKELRVGSSFSFNLGVCKDVYLPETIHTPFISGHTIKAPSEVVMDVIYGNENCNEDATLKQTMTPPATDENMRRCYRWLNLHSRKFAHPSKTTICEKSLRNERRRISAITSYHSLAPFDNDKKKYERLIKAKTKSKKSRKLQLATNPCEINPTNSQAINKLKVKSKATSNVMEPNDGDHLYQTGLSTNCLRSISKQSKTRRNNQIVTPNDVMQTHPSMFLRGSKLSFDVEICKGGTAQIRYSKPKTFQKQAKSKDCSSDCAKECPAFCDLGFDQFDSSSHSTSIPEKNSWNPVRYRNFLKQVLGPSNKSNPQPKIKKIKNLDTKEKKANKNIWKRNNSDHNKLRKQSSKKYKCACLVTPEESTQFKRTSRHSLISDLSLTLSPNRRYDGYPKPKYLTQQGRKKRPNSNAPSEIDHGNRKSLEPHQKESEINMNVQRSVSSILKKCLSTLKFQKAKKDEVLNQGRSEETSFDSSKRMQALRISGANVVPGRCTYLEYPVLLDKKYTDISRSISNEHRKLKKNNHFNNLKSKDISSSKLIQPNAMAQRKGSNPSLNVEKCLISRSPQKLAPLLPKFCKDPQEQYRGIHMSQNVNKPDTPAAYRYVPRELARKKHTEVTEDTMTRKLNGLEQRRTLDRVSESKEMLVKYDSNNKHSQCLLRKQLRSKQMSRTNFNFEYFFELSPTYNIRRHQDKAVARSSRGKRSSTLVNPTLANPSSSRPTKTKHFYGPDGRLLQRRSSIIVAAMWKVIKDDELRIQRTKLHRKGTPCKCKKGAPCQIVNKTTCRDKGSKDETGKVKAAKGKGGGEKKGKGKSGKKCACGAKGGGKDKGGKSPKGGEKVEKAGKGGICGKHAKNEKGGKGKCQGKGKCPSAMDKQEEDEEKFSREDYPEISDMAFKVLHVLKLLPDKKKYVKPKAYKVKCPGKKKCMKKKGDEEDDEEEEAEEEEDEEKLRKKILETLYITKDKMKFKFDSDICHKVQGKKEPPFFNPPGKLQKSVCEWPGCKDEIEKLKRPCTVCGFNDDAALQIKVDRHGMGVVNKEALRKQILDREVTTGKKKVKCSEFLKDTRPGDRPTCLCCPTPICTKHDTDKGKKPPCGMQITLDPKYSLKMPCSPFRPCVCGSGVCKKEHTSMIHQMARPKFIPCVCGSPVCEEERKHVAERKHAKEAMKLKRKLMKIKAEHRDFSLKNLDAFYLNSYLQGDLELKLFQDTMRGLPLSAQEKDTLVKRDKERELRADRNCQYRMRRYAEIEEEIARLRRKDDKKATFLMGDPYKLSTLSAVTGSISDLARASKRGFTNVVRKGFRAVVDPSCPEGKLPCKERFMIKLRKDYCYGHIKTPLQRAQARITTFGCVRYLLECLYEHPTLYECLTSCTEKGQELRRKRARLRQEIRDAKCTVATDAMLNPPCPACYVRFPGLYPRLLSIVSIYRQCKDMLCFLLAVLVWTPCLLFAEAVRAAICCSLCL